jgi:hypothetical protein
MAVLTARPFPVRFIIARAEQYRTMAWLWDGDVSRMAGVPAFSTNDSQIDVFLGGDKYHGSSHHHLSDF